LTGQGQDLAGAGHAAAVFSTKSAARVLVNGDTLAAPAGRSDDFKWPRRGIAPFGTDPVVATTTDPVIAAEPPPPPPVTAAAEAKPTDAKPARRSTRQSRNRRNSHRAR
jgi:hypothetical protein